VKLQRYQVGASLYGVIFVVLVAVFVGHTFFKLFPAYMENLEVASVIKSVGTDADAQYSRPSDVLQAIIRRFGVNQITRVGRDDISVVRDGDYYLINVDYKVTVPYLWNISLLLEFKHEAEVRAR
jgi:hypothetical protein